MSLVSSLSCPLGRHQKTPADPSSRGQPGKRDPTPTATPSSGKVCPDHESEKDRVALKVRPEKVRAEQSKPVMEY